MKTEIVLLLAESEALKAGMKIKLDEIEVKVGLADKKVNDIYHVFEFCKLDAVKMVKLSKILVETLKYRRELKECKIIFTNCLVNGKQVSHEEINSNSRMYGYDKESKQAFKKLLGE